MLPERVAGRQVTAPPLAWPGALEVHMGEKVMRKS
jgi:hypothetical protein